MDININPLFDKEFLKKLISKNEREIYARITALDINELPIECIEGNITDGSINVDGKSIVRRTCNLTMTAQTININEFYWGIRNKFILEIGLKNTIDKNYPDIIWFKQGLFIITQFSTTEATNKWTIKISGKDKMCLLNGDVSGHLPHETDFGKEEYRDLENDTVSYKDILIKDIIRYIVQDFGQELPQNIIINDIDDAGLELLEYHNEQPAYLYKEPESNEFKNIILDGDTGCYYPLKTTLTLDEYNSIPEKKYPFLKHLYQIDDYGFYKFNINLISDYQEALSYIDKDNDIYYFKGSISDQFFITYDNLLNNVEFDTEPTLVRLVVKNKDNNYQLTDKEYILAKIENGDTPGYFLTDLTFAGDLIAKAGETLTSVLDKIKNMLSNFEYFYDINGKFIFQKKKEYLLTSWGSTETNINRSFIDPLLYGQDYVFNFIDSILISSFQNTPKITDIKNDYCVWGSYNNSGTEIPIHMRFAIDNKPTSYKPIRPLKEEIVKILKDKNQNEITREVTYKYYDAPDIEPYDDSKLEKLTDIEENINGFSASKVIVPLENGNTQETYIYPYFAKESYETKDIINIQYLDPYKVLVAQFKVMSDETYEKLMNEYIVQDEEDSNENKYNFLKTKLSKEYLDLIIEKTYLKYGVDWRELIYQMALDYRKCHYDDDFLYYVAQANPQYSTGKTGYEQYYIDLEGFWRTLYDPNPQINYTPLPFDEVKKYSYLSDNNNINDSLDQIYIEQGYRNITYDEFTNPDLTIGELYKFSKPINSDRTFMYPVVGSDACCLEFSKDYYVNENGEMLRKNASSESASAYTELNKIALNNIYLKNLQNFTVVDENNFQNYITKLNEENNFEQFKVLYYPIGSSLGVYNNDYVEFIGNSFDNIKKISIPNYNRDKYIYYVKDKGYIPLLKYKEETSEERTDFLWNHIYTSNFYTFSYLAGDLISTKDKLKTDFQNNNLSSIDDEKLEQTNILNEYLDLNEKYLGQIANLVETYYLKMNQFTDFTEINNSLYNELLVILENTKNNIFDYFNNYHNQDYLTEDYSCLPIIFNNYKRAIEELFSHSEDSLSSRFEKLKSIYQYLKNSNNDIKANYNGSSFILEYEKTIESITEINEIKNIILEIQTALNNVKEETQQITISKNYIKNHNFQNYNSIDDIKNQLTTYLFSPIKYLKVYLKNFKNLTVGEQTSIIDNCYYDFYSLLNKIKNLPDLFALKVNNFDQLVSYISFKRRASEYNVIFLEDLYNDLYKDWENPTYLSNTLNKYLQNTYDFQEYLITEDTNNFNKLISETIKQEKINYYRGSYNYNHVQIGGNFWSHEVYTNPHLLLFWFDFLDAQGAELEKMSVPAIGQRTKVVNDKNIKGIYYKETPNIIFTRSTDQDYEIKSGYTYIKVNNNTETYFSISSKGKSAKERIDELLYEGSYAPESISISTIPVYYLEPNNYIFVRDDKSNIYGKYLIDKITIPLSYKKTMTITATKAVTDIV